ncbi:universal stress protein [filamentous cyanobacterium LEGE 11480]|uniref:Universal stress protein n=1 Tax=Romeriopsis navalis LEGE 11480 TaxID=2777977 RepID=A0A928VPQ4_9CYAN|nr:universal stress protein [Romeriopsis navalis]MBE9030340.1 universal stress protein [Romeriopsis navalis LEGE 11480]
MLKTILLALDAEPAAQPFTDRLLAALQDLHLDASARVILSHVVSTDSDHLDIAADRPPSEIERSPHHCLEQQLRHYGQNLQCLTEVEVVMGDPAEEIVRLARIYRTDLVVVGSRGLTGMEKILRRSVSAQVSEEAPCSVLVIKP